MEAYPLYKIRRVDKKKGKLKYLIKFRMVFHNGIPTKTKNTESLKQGILKLR